VARGQIPEARSQRSFLRALCALRVKISAFSLSSAALSLLAVSLSALSLSNGSNPSKGRRRTFARKARLGFRAESAHNKYNQADQQDQAKAAAADGRPANIKTAAAEQEKKNNDKKEYIHDWKIALRRHRGYGALTCLLDIHHKDTKITE
jgi:hypothetical protein